MSSRRWIRIFTMTTLILSACSYAAAQVTSPEAYLGFKPGADFHLANYEQAIGYLEHIAAQTDRMQVLDMGPTSYGRRMKYAVISSESNMARLEEFKSINARMSLVRDVSSREEAERLAAEGRAVIWIDCGLHASETSPAQTAIQLAYDVVTGEDWRMQLIRDQIIFLLVFANPDGMTMVSDWYTGNLGTPYETSRMPELYQKYAGHDNNRDSFIANLQEVRNMNRATCKEWFPEILYNMHETAPFPARIWIPPESEPMNPNVHPIIVRWKNLIGAAMGKAFEENEQPGAISRIYFDSWYPGYVTQFVGGHNTPSILTETANFRYATPHYYTLYDFPESHRDLVKGVFYPTPWRGGWWRLGDAVAYNLTAAKAILEVAAKYKREFLLNKWRMGSDVIRRFKEEPPYGWIFPVEQPDWHSTAMLLNRCILNGVEVYSTDEGFEHDGISYAEGTILIPTSQPFGLFTKNILEKQNYPDLREHTHLWQGIVGSTETGSTPLRAYDGVGWTLPVQMGVKYREMSSPLELPMTLLSGLDNPNGRIEGGGSAYVLSSRDNASFIAVNRILEAGGRVSRAADKFSLGESTYPKGTFIVEARGLGRDRVQRICAETGALMRAGSVRVNKQSLKRPRVALYKSWVANMDAGWISYLFDHYGVSYRFLTDAEVKAGNLRDRFDVIVLPDQRASSIIDGHRKGTMPPDYIGGMTMDGVRELKAFVEQGGTLVCNKSSCDLAVEHFYLPVRNVLQDVRSDSFACPGSILRMRYDPDHPIAFGLEKDGTGFFSRGRVFEMVKDTVEAEGEKEKKGDDKTAQARGKKKRKPRYAKVKPVIVASYPAESLLVSGWIHGEEAIQEKAAVLFIPYEKGRLVLFGFSVHNRVQSHSTFKLMFNALIHR